MESYDKVAIFSDFYPRQPQIFRFISILYHLNVAPNGMICIGLGKAYNKWGDIKTILQNIINFLKFHNSKKIASIESYAEFKMNLKN